MTSHEHSLYTVSWKSAFANWQYPLTLKMPWLVDMPSIERVTGKLPRYPQLAFFLQARQPLVE